MPKLDEAQMREILAPTLPAGQTLTHCAYGVRQPNLLIVLPAFLVAIVPGVILMQYLTKHYVVGLSGDRLAIAQVRPKLTSVSVDADRVDSVRLVTIPAIIPGSVKTKIGGLFTKIQFEVDGLSFKAKFHRAFSKTNRTASIAIAEAVNGA